MAGKFVTKKGECHSGISVELCSKESNNNATFAGVQIGLLQEDWRIMLSFMICLVFYTGIRLPDIPQVGSRKSYCCPAQTTITLSSPCSRTNP
ncbi:hypothetical protein FHD39_20270 [Escherichia coli]|nr:hypothetical protein [Escherichia coli]